MPEQEKTLFVPVVSSEKLNPSFKLLRDQPSYHPARTMLDHIYQGFIDLDGNFLNQSQGGMCIFGVLRVGVGVAQQAVGP